MINILAYKIDSGSWQKFNPINIQIPKSQLEDLRKQYLGVYPGSKKCLFIYEEM